MPTTEQHSRTGCKRRSLLLPPYAAASYTEPDLPGLEGLRCWPASCDILLGICFGPKPWPAVPLRSVRCFATTDALRRTCADSIFAFVFLRTRFVCVWRLHLHRRRWREQEGWGDKS